MARPATPVRSPAPRKTPTRGARDVRPPAAPAGSTDTIDTRLVRDIAAMLAGTDLTEIEVEKGDLRIRVARGAAAPAALAPSPVSVSVGAPATVAAMPAAPVKPADHPGAVKSPMVGTAFRRPSPEAKAFVEVGSTVAAGERVLLVEAMKTFNEIVAPRAGAVSAILVEDGQPVEYGQALLIIE